MERWFRLHYEPTLRIGRENGVAGVTQLVRAVSLSDALPAFMQGVLAMIGHEGEHVHYRVFDTDDSVSYVDTVDSGMIGYWWFTEVSPEEIEEYVL